jgi:tol-pal system protein YbgF
VLDLLDFLGRYPKHPLAPAAQYWIGEAYFLQRDYRQAIVEFEKVLEHGTTNSKVPDALLRAGMAWRRLRDPERASQAWQRVVHEFPRSEAAQRARTLLNDTASAIPR